jgi:hypothetical protein
MKIPKSSFLFIALALVILAFLPALKHRPVFVFAIKATDGKAEAFKISAPLNGQDAVAEPVTMNPDQKRETLSILSQKDIQHLKAFSKNFGVYPVVVGVPETQNEWPEFLGGGIKSLFKEPSSEIFDNLQWTDRIYLALSMKPPATMLMAGVNIPAALPTSTPTGSGSHPIPTPSTASALTTLRVEILNGCGITNAADWVAWRLKGPGIVIADTGNADNFKYSKTLIHTCVALPEAFQLKLDRLGLSKDSIETTARSVSTVDVVVIVGKDYPKMRQKYRGRNRH